MNRSGRSLPAGPAMTPQASSGWSARAWATISSYRARGMVSMQRQSTGRRCSVTAPRRRDSSAPPASGLLDRRAADPPRSSRSYRSSSSTDPEPPRSIAEPRSVERRAGPSVSAWRSGRGPGHRVQLDDGRSTSRQRVQHLRGRRWCPLAPAQRRLGVPAELRGRLGVVAVAVGKQPRPAPGRRACRPARRARRSALSGSALGRWQPGALDRAARPADVASPPSSWASARGELDDAPGARPTGVRMRLTCPSSARSPTARSRAAPATSRSISSRVPRRRPPCPSWCTSSISFCAFSSGVAEDSLEHEGDVGHQVDRVVPDDRDPGLVGEPDRLVGSSDVDARAGVRSRPSPPTPCLTPGSGHRRILAAHYAGWHVHTRHGAAHRPLRAHDAPGGAARRGPRDRPSVFEVFARRLPHGRRYGVVAGTGRLLDALDGFRFGDDELAFLRAARQSSTSRPLELAARRTGSAATSGATPRASATSPARPSCVVEAHVRRGGPARDAAAVDPQPRLRHRVGRVPDGRRGRATGRCIEMGSRRTHEQAAVAAARAAYIAGFASTSNLEAGRALRRPDRRAPARTPSRCCTTTSATRSRRRSTSLGTGTTLLVDTYDVARGGRGPRSRSPAPELGAIRHRLRRPAALARQVARQLDDLGATRDPDHRHQRPRRVRHRGAGRGAGRRLRRRHVAGHRLAAPDGGLVYKLVARAGRATRRRCCRSPRRAPTRSRSAAASRRCAGATPAGIAEAEVIGIDQAPRRRRRRPPAARGARRDGESSGASRWTPRGRATATRGRAPRDARSCPAASRRSRRAIGLGVPGTPAGRRRAGSGADMTSRADRGRRAERLLRGRQPGRARRRRGGVPSARCCTAGSADAAERDYDHVVATRDHHIDPGAHFADHPDFVDTWPPHCVVGTDGRGVPPDPRPAAVRRGLPQGRVRRRPTPASRARSPTARPRRLAARRGGRPGRRLRHRHRLLRPGHRAGRRRAGFRTRVLLSLTAAVAPDRMDETVDELVRADVAVAR